ncbi:MAG: alginate export family protein, partial [Candidatus Omnitrophica bacterium]|nr:alginate export family protein [Candidatus Omnitrophota bacterium]
EKIKKGGIQMKRLLTICIMLTAIALIAAPAFAEVQNVKVSGDVNSGAVYRGDYYLLSNNSDDDNTPYNFLYTQARIRVDADLTDNVMATVRLLSEFDWNTTDNTGSTDTGDNVDLDLANVTLKEVFYQPLTVTVGRQELRYGNAFIVGDPDTNAVGADADFTAGDLSLRKSFDAIKAVFDYSPLVVDVIYSKIHETYPATLTASQDVNLYGVNAAYDIGNYDSEIEVYWFSSTNDTVTTPAAGMNAGHSIQTIGARGSITPIDNLNLLGEIAIQRGDYNNETVPARDQDALAYQVAGEYAFPDITMPWTETVISSPMVKVGYTHYSGEETGNTGDHEAWIPLYEDQTHGVIANYILGGVNGGQNSNADILNIGGSISPMQDLTVSLDWYKFWLDEKLVTADGMLASANSALAWTNLTKATYYMNSDDDLGFELDLVLSYDYTEDVKMGLSAGYFQPGDAFQAAASSSLENGETAVQVLATLDVAF